MICGGGAKNKTHTSKKNLPPTNKNNITMANNKIDMSMYSDHPLWLIRWYCWSEKEQNLAQKIKG